MIFLETRLRVFQNNEVLLAFNFDFSKTSTGIQHTSMLVKFRWPMRQICIATLSPFSIRDWVTKRSYQNISLLVLIWAWIIFLIKYMHNLYSSTHRASAVENLVIFIRVMSVTIMGVYDWATNSNQDIFSNQDFMSTSLCMIPFMSAIATRCCSIVSRWRMVTVLSSKDWWSTVIQNGVPLASCLR